MSAIPSLESTPSGISRGSPNLSRVRAGVMRALPIALGYIPIGFAFAALGLTFSLSPLQIFLMSALVFACSSQIVALQMIAQDATVMSIVVTTFVVNLRHILMSSTLAPYLQRYKKRHIALFSFLLCDEAFALHSSHWDQDKSIRNPHKWETYAVNITLYTGWLFGNAMALSTGISPAGLQKLGLDFAPISMLLGILILLARQWIHVVVMVFCGALALALRSAGVGSWGIMVATLVGATLGLGCEQWIRKKSS